VTGSAITILIEITRAHGDPGSLVGDVEIASGQPDFVLVAAHNRDPITVNTTMTDANRRSYPTNLSVDLPVLRMTHWWSGKSNSMSNASVPRVIVDVVGRERSHTAVPATSG
jgi:hypothetical protein